MREPETTVATLDLNASELGALYGLVQREQAEAEIADDEVWPMGLRTVQEKLRLLVRELYGMARP